jgi:hypothetical protein
MARCKIAATICFATIAMHGQQRKELKFFSKKAVGGTLLSASRSDRIFPSRRPSGDHRRS